MRGIIRDGRTDRKIAADGKGEILGWTELPDDLDIGDLVELADGTRVPIIGMDEDISAYGVTSVVYVGDPR